jgi:hypothetical protein
VHFVRIVSMPQMTCQPRAATVIPDAAADEVAAAMLALWALTVLAALTRTSVSQAQES